jgi:hypothetical protein
MIFEEDFGIIMETNGSTPSTSSGQASSPQEARLRSRAFNPLRINMGNVKEN